MTVLLSGVFLLIIAFAIQIIIWRLFLPRSQTKALLAIFGLVALAAMAAAAALGNPLMFSGAEATRLAIAYVACALAYVVFYSAIEMQSPTLAIVSRLAANGSQGCSYEELLRHCGGDATMLERISAIENSGWVQREGDRLTLTSVGTSYAQIFERGSTLVGLRFLKGG